MTAPTLEAERAFAEAIAEEFGYATSDIPALVEWERYRRGAATEPGMPGLRAIPCFVAGFNLGRTAAPVAADVALPPLPEPKIAAHTKAEKPQE